MEKKEKKKEDVEISSHWLGMPLSVCVLSLFLFLSIKVVSKSCNTYKCIFYLLFFFTTLIMNMHIFLVREDPILYFCLHAFISLLLF